MAWLDIDLLLCCTSAVAWPTTSLSVLPPPLWWRVTRAVVVVVALAGIVIGVLLGSDGLRLLPCLQPNAQCVEVEAAEFTDICSFETMPYRSVTQ